MANRGKIRARVDEIMEASGVDPETMNIITKGEPEPRGAGLTEHLKSRILACGISPYEIAKRAGIAPQVIYKFQSGRDITLASADKILAIVDGHIGDRLASMGEARQTVSDAEDRHRAELAEVLDRMAEFLAAERQRHNL
jgi:transcriptional regulator with XRE-family HTH domain